MSTARWRVLLPGLWAGWLLCVALLATPAPFALLAAADAGRVAGRMLAQEAWTSLAMGVVVLWLERRAAAGRGERFDAGMGLALATLACTGLGYFAVLPLMSAARAGQGVLGFAALHAISSAFFAVKLVVVLALAWRATRATARTSS
jgi:hypothetical protein